jgi:hypothetical protein
LSPRTPPGDIAGFEDVPFWPLTSQGNVAEQFGVPGSIDLVAGSVQPVAIVGDARGTNPEEHVEIFSASGWVAAAAGDAGLFEFHHPQEPAPFLVLPVLLNAIFDFASGNTTGAVKSLIQGETSRVSKLVVVLDVALSFTAVTNAAGTYGGVQWINPGFGSAPVLIDLLALLIATGSSYRSPAGTRARARLWAGRRNDGSALPLQGNLSVAGSTGAMTMMSSSTGAQAWHPFARATPFIMLPGRGFAIGFGTTGVGQQSNVQAACSVIWKEIPIGETP